MYDVKGHRDLARDPQNNMIVNVNGHDYEHYVASRNAKKAQHEDLDNLKGEIGEIKSLLKELVNGN